MKLKTLLLAAAAAVLIISGIAGYRYITQANKSLEPFQDSEEVSQNPDTDSGSTYRYLKKYTLKAGKKSIRIYLPDDIQKGEDSNSASAQFEGIQIDAELIADEKTDTEKLTQDKIQSVLQNIENIENVQDISKGEVLTENGNSIQQVGYSINDGEGTLYPCMAIVKTDSISEDAYLSITLRIDNSAAGEETSEILKEIIQAYGISLD